MLTDDDLSELAEALIDACEEAIGSGATITEVCGQRFRYDCNCPMGCLIGVHFPHAGTVTRALGGTTDFWWSFIEAFDGEKRLRWGSNQAMFNLGRSLRERYMGAA